MPSARHRRPTIFLDFDIEAGTEQTWDHGISDHMDVDLSPRGIAYLAFDLRGVTGPVTSATLTLWCTNSSNDGGTVHPVAALDRRQPDRHRHDERERAGAQVGRRRHQRRRGRRRARRLTLRARDAQAIVVLGAVTSNRAVTVDLTAAFQQGARIYALAIRSASSDGATYSSREHPTAAQRPRLHVSFAAP